MRARRDGHLVFDSARASVAAGTRTAMRLDRTLLFNSGDFTVDVVLHDGPDALRLLHGQVVRESKGLPVARALVSLGAQSEAVETDEFGQFALSGASEDAEAVLRISAADMELVCTIPAAGMGVGGV